MLQKTTFPFLRWMRTWMIAKFPRDMPMLFSSTLDTTSTAQPLSKASGYLELLPPQEKRLKKSIETEFNFELRVQLHSSEIG